MTKVIIGKNLASQVLESATDDIEVVDIEESVADNTVDSE